MAREEVVLKTDHEVAAVKQQLEGAVDAVERAPERGEGKILMPKDGVLEYLRMGAELAGELEELRAAAENLIDDIETRVKMSSQKHMQNPKKGASRLKMGTLLRAQGVGLAVGAVFFFLADDSLWISVLIGVVWALVVLASDWQCRRIKDLEAVAVTSAAQIHRIKEIIDEEIFACREAAHHSSMAHDSSGLEFHEDQDDALERLLKKLFPGEKR